MTADRQNLDWMLKDLVTGVPGTRHVVVLSADGFRIAQCATDDDAADRLSAACSALQSLSSAIAAELPRSGAMRMVVIEYSGGFFFLMAAGPGAFLATLADVEVDAGLMGERMRDLVGRLGEHLAASARSGTPSIR
ncbi:MAG: roadblock/LC7 domain-containing protein [Catenulispora sp.]|nr:roadblock/LC7 domain-containing protein [Catenulispora sp.]